MNSDVRFRSARQNNRTNETSQLQQKQHGNDRNQVLYGTPHVVGICILLLAFSYAVYTCDTFLPKSKPITVSLREFSGDRARTHLKSITDFGPRPAGSYSCDIAAVNYLLKQLNLIKEEANSKFDIDVEVQMVSGSFAFVRKVYGEQEWGMTSTYDNVTNVIVKIAPSKSTNHFVLANAHFDTVMNTEGASDDTVSCAVLIEIFRAISSGKVEDLKHGVIFLFNGGEEGGLAGSHAFLQHRWFPLVKILVNVEAAGSGGREFVFQTGPGHPWIIGLYASSAKYPYACVLAQEVFQTGVIPSETDFNIFVRYGKLAGIDIAFVSNGYVYHTRYDDAKSIPSGSIQRAGDNILGLIKAIANSEYLENPGEYKHGSAVFFDVLGVFLIHYTKRIHMFMNNITCGAVLLYIIYRLVKQKFSSTREHIGSRYLTNSAVSVSSLSLASITILFSWILALLFPVAIALLLTKLNLLMTWYPYPKFALALYGLPALFGMLLGHFIGNQLIKKISVTSTQSFVCAHLLINTSLLFYANQKEIASSFLLWLWIIFPFIFLCLVLDNVSFLPERKDLATYLLHIVAVIPPLLMSMYELNQLFVFFGPLFGRTGHAPSDVVMAILSTLSIVLTLTYFMSLYHSAVNMKRFLFTVGLLCIIPFLYVLSGRMHPYSAKNPITPKRLYMIHTTRTFHNSDGSIQRTDSGVWLQPVDALQLTPLKHLEYFKNAEYFQCDGSYCGLPYYYARRKMMQHPWYLRGEVLKGDFNALSTNIYRRIEQDDGSVRFYFDITGPDHMALFLTLKGGVSLDWSFYKTEDNYIYSMSDHHGGRTHVVFYTHGYHHGSWTFWMQFKRSSSSLSQLAELGIARHYLHGKNSRSKFLNATINALPDWVYGNPWCSTYDSFALA